MLEQMIISWRENSHEKELVESCTCNFRYCGCCTSYLFYMMRNNKSVSIWKAIWSRKVNVVCITIAVCIYFLNKTLLIDQMTGFVGYFCRCHLNDFVCPLFFLGYCQILLIWINHEIQSYRNCILLGMVGGLIWEYIAPLINPKAVSDVIDLICYFSGTSLYYFLLKSSSKKAKG